MQALLRRLLQRIALKVERSARGTALPAGLDRPEPGERVRTTARERTLMRRRLRTLRKLRKQLAEGEGPRANELEEIEAEERTLRDALGQMRTLDELLASGALARCPSCGDLVAQRDRNCPACAARLPGAREPAPHSIPRTAHAGGGAAQPVVTGASSGRSSTPPAR
jgi:hypothetical protein